MTATQDWLSSRPVDPVDPEDLKAFICDALRGLTVEEPTKVQELALIRPGIERC